MKPRLVLWSVLSLSLVACSRKSPLAPEPVGNEPGPDLRAEEVYLFVPGFPIGRARPSVPAASIDSRKVATRTTAVRFLGEVIGGASPAVIQEAVGNFPDYRIHFYVNDLLWWDRQSSVQTPPGYGRREGIFGMQWMPPDTGLYTIRVVLDAGNRYAEIDETNNEATAQVRVIPGNLFAMNTDYWIETYGYVTSVKVGTPVRAIVRAGAHGRFPNVRRVVTFNGAVESDGFVDVLGGGLFPGFRDDTLEFVPSAPGAYTITLSVDPDDEKLERTRSDNFSTRTLTVTP